MPLNPDDRCRACLPNQPCPGHMPKQTTCTCSEFWRPCPHCVKEHFEGRMPHLEMRCGTIVAGPIVKTGFAKGQAHEGCTSGKSTIQMIKNYLFKKKELPMNRRIHVKFSALQAEGCMIRHHKGKQRVYWPDNAKRYGLPEYSDSLAEDFLSLELDSNDITPIEAFLRDRRVPRSVEYMEPALKVVSIQLAATRQSAGEVEVVPEDAEDKTHYSIYLRREDGCAEIDTDFDIRMQGTPARSLALAQAARLSIEHQVPIERIP